MEKGNLSKRLLATILCVLFALSLTACGQTKNSDTDDNEKVDNTPTRTQESEIQETETSSKEEVSLSNVTYNANDGTINGTIINNTGERLDSVHISGTVDYLEPDEYGKEATQTKLIGTPSISFYPTETDGLGVTDIEAHGEKSFTFEIKDMFGVEYDRTKASNPQLEISLIVIRDIENPYDWYAKEDEYKVEFIETDGKGRINNITITNNSDYQWEQVVLGIEYIDENGQICSTSFEEMYVDKGATKTVIETDYTQCHQLKKQSKFEP